MNPTKTLHDLGQSLWLDNITRDLLNSGALARYIDELSVTGLTSNPTIFDHAIKNSATYDDAIRRNGASAKSAEDLFFGLALEVSPLFAHDTNRTLADAKALHARGGKPNLFIKIPGTKEGLPAIEEAI